MAKLTAKYDYRKDGSKNIKGYIISLSKLSVEEIAKMSIADEITIEYKENEIIIKKGVKNMYILEKDLIKYDEKGNYEITQSSEFIEFEEKETAIDYIKKHIEENVEFRIFEIKGNLEENTRKYMLEFEKEEINDIFYYNEKGLKIYEDINVNCYMQHIFEEYAPDFELNCNNALNFSEGYERTNIEIHKVVDRFSIYLSNGFCEESSSFKIDSEVDDIIEEINTNLDHTLSDLEEEIVRNKISNLID